MTTVKKNIRNLSKFRRHQRIAAFYIDDYYPGKIIELYPKTGRVKVRFEAENIITLTSKFMTIDQWKKKERAAGYRELDED